MSRRSSAGGGYTRLRSTGVGAGAAELLWSVAGRLRGATDRLDGRVVAVFDRTMYVSLPVATADDRPALVALGTDAVRDGPLVVHLDAPRGFSFDRQGVERGTRVTLSASGNGGLCLDLSRGPLVDVEAGVLPTLPAGGGWYGRVNSGRFAAASVTVTAHRTLVSRLLSDGVEDGLGLLAQLDARPGGRSDTRLDRVADALAGSLAGPSALPVRYERDGPRRALPDPVAALVGRGPGATPSGDDVLLGAMLVLLSVDDEAIARRSRFLSDAVGSLAADETTTVSAAFLAQATRRRAASPTLEFLRTILRPGADAADLSVAADAVLDVGHTSGADTLAGMLMATTAVLPTVAERRG